MKATVDMTLEPHLPRGFVVKEDELPIASLSKLLREKKNQKYDLRSIFQEKQFLAACTVLVEKCYQVMLVTNSDNQDVYNDQLVIEEAEIQEERKNEVANGNLFIHLGEELNFNEKDFEDHLGDVKPQKIASSSSKR